MLNEFRKELENIDRADNDYKDTMYSKLANDIHDAQKIRK